LLEIAQGERVVSVGFRKQQIGSGIAGSNHQKMRIVIVVAFAVFFLVLYPKQRSCSVASRFLAPVQKFPTALLHGPQEFLRRVGSNEPGEFVRRDSSGGGGGIFEGLILLMLRRKL